MFHATYALCSGGCCLSLLCQCNNPACWNLNFKYSAPSWEFKWSPEFRSISEGRKRKKKWGISRPVRQNSSQGSHMSTVCVRLFIHLHAYMCVCVCVCVAGVPCVCVGGEDYYPLPPCIKLPLIQCQRPDPNMAERQHVTCLAFHPRLLLLQAAVAAAAVVVVVVRCGREGKGGRCCGVQGRWGKKREGVQFY